MQLPLKQRLKLARQRAYAAVNFAGHVPVSVEESQTGVVINVDGKKIHAPSPLRWKLYKYGWEARLDRLEAEYGVGRHVSLKPNSVVLDIGANAGEFAHVCARYGAEVHCFEPDPDVHACLLKNIDGLPQAHAHDTVIWKEDGEIDFGLAPERADSSVFTDSGAKLKKRTVTIETFCRENEIPRIDFIKCDAEGAEPEVLEGIGGFFPNVGAVALDTGAERNGARTHDACAEILSTHGFEVVEEKICTRWMTYGINKEFRTQS